MGRQEARGITLDGDFKCSVCFHDTQGTLQIILTGLKELFSTPNVRLEPGLEIFPDVAIRIKHGDIE